MKLERLKTKHWMNESLLSSDQITQRLERVWDSAAAAAEPTTILPLGFGGLVTANFHSLHLSLHVDDELGQLV